MKQRILTGLLVERTFDCPDLLLLDGILSDTQNDTSALIHCAICVYTHSPSTHNSSSLFPIVYHMFYFSEKFVTRQNCGECTLTDSNNAIYKQYSLALFIRL